MASSVLLCSWLLATAWSGAAAAVFNVSSLDASVTLSVDDSSGNITSVSVLGRRTFPVSGAIVLEGCAVTGTQVISSAGGVTVVRTWTGEYGSATTTDVFSPAASSVDWSTSTTTTTSSPWSTRIHTAMTHEDAPSLRLWSAWDRDSYSAIKPWVDPLLPSDGEDGWWSGCYRYGNPRSSLRCDFISSALVSVMSLPSDAGITVAASPGDVPMDVFLFTSANSGWTLFREGYRINASSPIKLNVQVYGHAADWRASMGAVVTQWPEYYTPVNVDVFRMAGLGSYSSYLGSVSDEYAAMGYTVDWDLSGRFFPYMGQYRPPFNDTSQQWMNDPEGSQKVMNVSFDLINEYYGRVQSEGYATLSYWNVNEYGINMVFPSSSDVLQGDAGIVTQRMDAAAWNGVFDAVLAPAPSENDWPNASIYFANHLNDSLMVDSWDALAYKRLTGPLYSWQGAVVVNPGVASYHNFMLEQLARQLVYEPDFQGIIIDRSDWMDFYSLTADDGVSWAGNTTACSLKVTYAAMVADLRAAFSAAARRGYRGELAGSGIMMQNTAGNCRTDVYRFYDASFSEGYAVNGAGLLGVRSPAILWTYDSTDCCNSSAVAQQYFQQRLYMGVCPMAPFPENDHAIAPDPVSINYYLSYGGLFSAIATNVWLLEPYIVAVANASSVTAKVNAFVCLVNRTALPSQLEQAVVIPVVLASVDTGTVLVNVTGVDRAWTARNVHPLLSAHADAANAGSSSGSFMVDVTLPGGNGTWTWLLNTTSVSFTLSVPVADGAAVVRVRQAAP